MPLILDLGLLMNATLLRSGRVNRNHSLLGLIKCCSLFLSHTFAPRSTLFKNLLEKIWGCQDSNSVLLGEESDHKLCAKP